MATLIRALYFTNGEFFDILKELRKESSKMNFIKAEQHECNIIFDLIKQAKVFLKEQGIIQWQEGYPNLDDIKKDILLQKGYVLKDNGIIVGYACIDFDGEIAYKSLKGKWVSDNSYVTVHRIVINNKYKGKGLAKQIFVAVEEIAKENGIKSIRVDTDENNIIMKHIISSLAYIYCGIVSYYDGNTLAYEKVL
jgi:predicted GNAT superfamily acetyltransferase